MTRAMTPDDVRELMTALPFGVLELCANESELQAALDNVSGRRVVIKMRSSPETLGMGGIVVAEVIEAPRAVGICRSCGCTEESACNPPCYWVDADLCSSCAPRAHPNLKPQDRVAGGAQIVAPSSDEVAAVNSERLIELAKS
jgi:hypothetical protein